MAGKNKRVVKTVKRRRAEDSVSRLFAHKHQNDPINEEGLQRPAFTERYFWQLACCVIAIWIIIRVFDFSLVPLSYRGLYINKPYTGLHSWHLTHQAWAARNHVKYGLDYTKGYRTVSVGDPPAKEPLLYVSHPPLEILVAAAGMLVLGTEDWAVRLFEIIASTPALLLIMYILSRLYGCSVGLFSGLLYVITPVFSYFALEYLWVLTALWALYRYLILTGNLKDGPQPCKRHFYELAVALFLTIQLAWAGVFYAFTIGLHYVVRSLIRWKVSWSVLTVITVSSLLSIFLSFYVMLSGTKHNMEVEAATASAEVQRVNEQPKTALGLVKTLYKWRASEGEMETFVWKDWLKTNAKFAVTNFTVPMLVLLGAYFIYLPIAFFVFFTRAISKGIFDYTEYIPRFYRYMWFFLLPGLLFFFTLKGLFWKHQYWQSPITFFVVIGASLSVFLIGDFFGTVSKWFGRFVIVTVFVPLLCYCNMGLVSYRDQVWHSQKTINMFKKLNKKIPADQALLTFKNFVIKQSEGKIAHYLPEYAWYIDRDMVVADAWQDKDSKARNVQIVDTVSATVKEIKKQVRTGRFSYYYIPERDSILPDPNEVGSGIPLQEYSRINLIEMDRKLKDMDFSGENEVLLLEKHRRYQELLIRKLKTLYDYEYYENPAVYGDKDYCYSGDTPCYIFDISHPK